MPRTSSDSASSAYVLRYWIGVVIVTSYLPALLFTSTALGLVWGMLTFLVFGAATLMLRCSDCSWPIFKRGALWVPWPSRTCPNCRHKGGAMRLNV
jgi:hypothetical protein